MEDSSEVLVCAAEYIKGEIDICVGLCGCHNIVPLNEYIQNIIFSHFLHVNLIYITLYYSELLFTLAYYIMRNIRQTLFVFVGVPYLLFYLPL